MCKIMLTMLRIDLDNLVLYSKIQQFTQKVVVVLLFRIVNNKVILMKCFLLALAVVKITVSFKDFKNCINYLELKET